MDQALLWLMVWLFGGLGVPALGWTYVRLRRAHKKLRERSRVRVQTFTTQRSVFLNEFYDEYLKRIRAARRNIYVAGEGFNYSTSDGVKYADRIATATEEALERGVRVVRLQTSATVYRKWLNHLVRLQDAYENFELYLAADPRAHDLAEFTVFDHDDSENCCAQFSLLLRRRLGSTARGLTATGVFICGDQFLAHAIADKILLAADDTAIATPLKDAQATRVALSRGIVGEDGR